MKSHDIGPRVILAALLIAVAGCNAAVNEDIEVGADDQPARSSVTVNGDVRVAAGAQAGASSFRTVNGEIRVGDGAEVSDCATVNGTVDVGAGVRSGDLETVNGNLRLGRDARVQGHIKVVNGNIDVAAGVVIDEYIETVNGRIELHGARIRGDLRNVNGGMIITDGSVVEGDLLVRDPGDDRHGRRPRIVIGPDSRVVGRLVFERPVELYVHDSAEIGPVDGAETVRFSGDEPG